MLSNWFSTYERRESLFVVLPSVTKPRIILPYISKKIFINAWNVQNIASPKNKIIRKIVLSLYPLLKYNKSIIIYPTKLLDQFVSSLKYNLKDESIKYYSIYIGTENSSNQKFTIQLMNDNGIPIGYVKVAFNKKALIFIKNEYKALKKMNNLNFEYIIYPKKYLLFQIENDFCLYQEAIFNDTEPHDYIVTELIINSLISIAIKTQNVKDVLKYYNKKKKEYYELPISYLMKKNIINSLNKIKKNIYPTIYSHGDFVPYNLRKRKDKLYIVDWEFFSDRGYPLYDLFTFIFQGGYYVYHKKPKYIIDKLFNDNIYKKIYLDYLKHLSISKDYIKDYFLIYLSEAMLREIYLGKSINNTNIYYIALKYFLSNYFKN